jgi:hypothetical protein
MRFNISYFGPEWMFHLRRDFILTLQYGLQSLGHEAVLSGPTMEPRRFNLIIGGYFMPPAEMAKLAASGHEYAHVNTEIIVDDTLNFNPDKVDFLGAYLPSMRAGRFVWDAVLDNLEEHKDYGTNAHFLHWGWHPKMEDIEHRADKDLDFYFFGMLSDRRRDVLKGLLKAGFRGLADHSCPYFLRNDRIARARVQLNVRQNDKYSHVNSFRICYLSNNACAIISEFEPDPAGYLEGVTVVKDFDGMVAQMHAMLDGDEWRRRGERALEVFKRKPMTQTLEKLIDDSFGGQR